MRSPLVLFLLNSIMLGVGLAMDAFSVSLANGLNEPKMKAHKMAGIAGVFAVFQAVMPLIGWVLVHTIARIFKSFEKCIPWIALILLCYIGIGMIREGRDAGEEEKNGAKLTFGALLVQGVATSIDALSVGFTIAEYDFFMALCTALIIGGVTFVICATGLFLGKRFGMRLSGKANILGGIILIAIGLEIFVTGVFF